MGVLQRDLPVSVCKLLNNPMGEKIQGKLLSIDLEKLAFDTGEAAPLEKGTPVRVEFRVDRYDFRFETTVFSTPTDPKLFLTKPKEMHKSRVRDVGRIPMDLEAFFTIWTETGRFKGRIIDLSELGIRMEGIKALNKGTLISLNFYIKEMKIRVICQGLVAWCDVSPENQYLYDIGVEFTTISNDTKKKLARFVEVQALTAKMPQRNALS